MSDRSAASLSAALEGMVKAFKPRLPADKKPFPAVQNAAAKRRVRRVPKFWVPEIEDPLKPHLACFVETETAQAETVSGSLPPSSESSPGLIAALDRSERFDGTRFFVNRRERRDEMTATAFVLFQALLAGGDAAFDLAVARIPPGLRQRAPSRAKLELLAVLLTAKPTTTEERKSCSAYSSLLIVAQARGITVESYREWASGTDLAEAEVQAKRIRAALKASAPDGFEGESIPHRSVYELQVAVLVDGKAKEAMRAVIEDDCAGELRSLIAEGRASGGEDEFVKSIFQALRVSDT